jgi:hypothetical protein
VISDSDVTVCDVIGCQAPPTGTYMNGVSHPGHRFFVCDAHRERLLLGVQPVILGERIAGQELDARPGLVLG